MNFRLIKFGVPLVFGLAVLVYGMLYRVRHPTPALPSPSTVELATEENFPVGPPVSIRELQHNLNEYSGPIRSGSFKGYRNLRSADPLKIKLNWNEVSLRLEWHVRGGGVKIWDLDDLGLFQFKKDLLSLVLRLPDQSLIYLKFEHAKILTAYPQSLQVFSGWHVKDRRAVKIVMIEDVQTGWPRADSLKDAWPGDLPY